LLYCATGTGAGGTSGTAQFVVRGDGNVGIGDTDPSEAKLSITGVASGDSGIKIDQDQNNYGLLIDSEATSAPNLIFLAPAMQTGQIIEVNDANSLTTGGCAYFFSNSADNTSSRNLVTIVNENAAADKAVGPLIQQDGDDAHIEFTGTGGGGIKFTADISSSDSDTLDDYEEGTWTPTMQIDTTSITSSGGVYSATGKYTKVGNLVHLQMTWIFGDNITIPSGTYWRIAGFPFAINIENYASVLMANWEAEGENIYGGAVTYHASSTIYIKKIDGTNFSPTVPTTWATGDQLSLIGTHLV